MTSYSTDMGLNAMKTITIDLEFQVKVKGQGHSDSIVPFKQEIIKTWDKMRWKLWHLTLKHMSKVKVIGQGQSFFPIWIKLGKLVRLRLRTYAIDLFLFKLVKEQGHRVKFDNCSMLIAYMKAWLVEKINEKNKNKNWWYSIFHMSDNGN